MLGTRGMTANGWGTALDQKPESLRRRYLALVMSVSVLLFASYADAFGTRRLVVPVAAPCPVGDVVQAMRTLPGGDRLPVRPLVAINQAYAALDSIVQPNDEVALIPPVAGG